MKRTEPYSEKKARSWQMSFNDLLTVLLVFFILMVSISNIRADKVHHVSSSAATVFGPGETEDGRAQILQRTGSIEGIDAYLVEGGVSLVLGESLLYRSGSAEIISANALTQLAAVLKATPGRIRIEGHTDALPVVGGLFASNWELSTQRAVNVVKFFIAECQMDPAVFSAAGYGDSKPVSTNETPEGRARNRRVNIIVSVK
jgi:chemotaxis protein MotB